VRRAFLFFTTTILLAFGASSAAAADVVTETVVEKDVTETFPVENPCTGERATVTIEATVVFHITELDDGTIHAHFTSTGSFTLDGITGHVTEAGSFSVARKGTTSETFSFTAASTEFTLKETFHFTVNAKGRVTAEVEVANIRCA
jgi:hypothetical protein